MQTYFFVLGTNHTLSKIDMVNTLQKWGIAFEIEAASEEVLLVKTETDLDVQSLMTELGSAAKIGKIFKTYPLENFPENFLEDVGQEEFKRFFLTKNVVNFGASVYGAGGKFKDLNAVFFLSRKIVREIKERLGDLGVEISYLSNKERELSTVTVNQRGLLTHGFELVLGVGEKEVHVGKTLVVQDYESYSARDYGRPARDAASGMIPPKLAKMMINLALKDKDKIFLDPFCGSGTFLQELILSGYKNLIGTDSSEKSIRDSETNLNWLVERFKLKKTDYEIKLTQADVVKLSSKVNFKTVTAIVTEPYLGSPQAKFFNPEQIKKEVAKLEKLYLAAFDEFRKVLKDTGVIVIVFPIFRFKDQFFELDIMDGIYALGFQKRELLISTVPGSERLNLKLTSRGGVIYFRPGQTVSREIFVFDKI